MWKRLAAHHGHRVHEGGIGPRRRPALWLGPASRAACSSMGDRGCRHLGSMRFGWNAAGVQDDHSHDSPRGVAGTYAPQFPLPAHQATGAPGQGECCHASALPCPGQGHRMPAGTVRRGPSVGRDGSPRNMRDAADPDTRAGASSSGQ
jgi:hypothetical protein